MSQSHEHDLTAQERELEQVLATALSARTDLRMERIEAEAARRRMARQLWTWRAIAAVLVVGLGVSLVVRPQARVVERLVEVPVELPAEARAEAPRATLPDPAAQPPRFIRPAAERRLDSVDSYIVLRDRVMEHGLDALPYRPPPGSAGPVPRVADVLQGLPGGDV